MSIVTKLHDALDYGATNNKILVAIEHATSETHKVHVAMGLERAVSQKLKVSHFLLIPFTAKKKDANHILITQVICYFISVPKLLSFWYKITYHRPIHDYSHMLQLKNKFDVC